VVINNKWRDDWLKVKKTSVSFPAVYLPIFGCL
jgi:hypothetical protein